MRHEKLFKEEKLWEAMSKLTRAVFPVMLVLRLADQKKPCMDKLYFYVRRMEETLKRSKVPLDEVKRELGPNLTDHSILLGALDREINIEDDSDDDDEIEDDDLEFQSSGNKSLSYNVFAAWDFRKGALITDWSIAGWMMSPIPEIYDDARANAGRMDIEALDRLIRKLKFPQLEQDEEAMDQFLNKFWAELEHFKSKTEMYSRAHIWSKSNEDFVKGNSYLWHKKNSIPTTEALGKSSLSVDCCFITLSHTLFVLLQVRLRVAFAPRLLVLVRRNDNGVR